jgi:hypothetical protein
MRTRPVDPAAIAALPEGLVAAAGEWFEPIDDVLLGHLGDDTTAAQAATARHQPIGQVEAADHLDDLLERGPNARTRRGSRCVA